MTREEAIKELKEDKMLYETDLCHAGDGSPDGRLLEALDMAIKALSDDFVKVVRCKDCIYYETCNLSSSHWWKGGYTVDIEFCSFGERREP